MLSINICCCERKDGDVDETLIETQRDTFRTSQKNVTEWRDVHDSVLTKSSSFAMIVNTGEKVWEKIFSNIKAKVG